MLKKKTKYKIQCHSSLCSYYHMTQIRTNGLLYKEEILKPVNTEFINLDNKNNTYIVLCSRHCCKPYTNINSFSPPNNHMRQVILLFPFHR